MKTHLQRWQRYLITLTALAIILIALSVALPIYTIKYENHWMDSPTTQDPSLIHPDRYLISKSPNISDLNRHQPIIIAIHGYSASTAEWLEFSEFARQHAIPVSLVLLGGHGRNIDAFRKATFDDWGQPIRDEYHRLVEQGFTNITILAASAGASLVLHDLATQQLSQPETHLRHLIFVDPFIIPGDKRLKYVKWLAPVLGNLPPKPNASDFYRRNWYNNSPPEPLTQLNNLVQAVQSEYQNGATLPQHTRMTVFKATDDPVAPASNAEFLRQHLRHHDGSPISITYIASKHHMFTRLNTFESAPATADSQAQLGVFEAIVAMIRRPNAAPQP